MLSDLYRNWPLPVIKRTVGKKNSVINKFSQPALMRLEELENKYDLNSWTGCCTHREFIANLYLLDILDTTFDNKPRCKSALDVGSAKWWYLPALKTYLPGTWTGVELSAKQRGKVFDTWKAQAHYFCNNYANAHYQSMCITELKQHYDFISWFLPYVAIDPLLASGLPEYYFDPAGLLKHVWNRLNPGGVLFIVNQGEAEAQLQEKMIAFEHIEAISVGPLESLFNPFQHQRYGWILHKSN